ncbi:MAG: galactose mutarotase [Candidatus Marinimicrobia bacterium]|nr:galactose mutarotase [Candidatus Neomarinimicrobiota bacterium]MCF7827423.1 galactose mutarotase [Candidatus Neomarinimicrobiota bacterium]MCF7881344.1 galactose mutarotase [Candidatus Neomarinimicrobiota bacterium]
MAESKPSIAQKPFGTLEDGTEVSLFTLRNADGITVEITNYGGTIVSAMIPDTKGYFADVIVGQDAMEAILHGDNPYFGALIGRYANRIDGGSFQMDGQTYELAQNDGSNHLHGGEIGFDKRIWDAKPMETEEGVALQLKYLSEDMEEGYPGNLETTVFYTLTNGNELRIEYKATTDAKTIVNFTNHAYWNLAGKGTVLDHEMTINASTFTPVNENLIPTGEMQPVDDTPFDFRKPKRIGRDIDANDQQITYANGGFDHNWVLNKPEPGASTMAARVTDPESRRMLEVWTTEPGMQFYSGNYLKGMHLSKGRDLEKHSALALETQHFPDSPNQPDFPSVELLPGEMYTQTTIYRFGLRK